jgi:hypothetical protein
MSLMILLVNLLIFEVYFFKDKNCSRALLVNALDNDGAYMKSFTHLKLFLKEPMPGLSAPLKERVSAADRKSIRLEKTTPRHNP